MKEKKTKHAAAGVILAAGLSFRMGETKALLKFGKETLIGRQIRCFLDAGVKDVFIVTGHDAPKVEAAVKAYPVKTVYNPDYKEGMFTSVKAGLKAVKRTADAVYLLPVDCPLITPQILEELLKKFSESGKKIVYPRHKGEKGHPPLFSAELIGEILGFSGEGGLKEALARFEDEAAVVEAASGCLFDMDTKEEYIQALERSGISKE